MEDDYRDRVSDAAQHALDAIGDDVPRVDAISDACDGWPIYYDDILDVLRHCDADIGELDVRDVGHAWDILSDVAHRAFEIDVSSRVFDRLNEKGDE